MVATASIKMDELLTSWLGSDAIYENVMRIIEQQKETSNNNNRSASPTTKDDESSPTSTTNNGSGGRPPLSPNVSMQEKPHFEIPPFYRNEKDTLSSASNNNTNNNSLDNPQNPPPAPPKRRLHSSFSDDQTWDGIYMTNREGSANVSSESIDKTNDFDRDSIATDVSLTGSGGALNNNNNNKKPCIAIQAKELFQELGVTPSQHRKLMEQEGQPFSPQYANVPSILSKYLRTSSDSYHSNEEDCKYIPIERFERLTKELCNLPTFFHKPLYERILLLWENHIQSSHEYIKLPSSPVINSGIFHYFWEM